MKLTPETPVETIFGGITRDTLADAYGMLDDELPACLLMNRRTSLEVFRVWDKDTPSFPPTQDPVFTDLDGVPCCISNEGHDPDDHIVVFTTGGNVKYFHFT